MEALAIRNFRCFASSGNVPLGPLTLLVGENSTGKTSFLAAVRLAWDLAHGFRRIDFNEEPFLLGAFDQIAHFRGGRAGRAETFEISFQSRVKARGGPRAGLPSSLDQVFSAEFRRTGSHPVIKRQTLKCGDYSFSASFPEGNGQLEVEIGVGDRELTRTLDEGASRLRLGAEAPIDWVYILHAFAHFRVGRDRQPPEKAELTQKELQEIEVILLNARHGAMRRPVAIAPVRSRPQRTYNPVSETPLPEGEHVPMVLARTYFENKQRWESLKGALDKFGDSSGLFSGLEIKPLGRHESDPFQIRVRIEGPPSNLVDVGYGVSQVLPILVDSLLADRGDLYLLQQPEVHLHPRAQAELGSFLGNLVATQAKRFVVETHSDYLIDRIRMDVRDRNGLKPEQVSLLFFERRGLEVAIRPMQMDESGNLLDAPTTYRRFFLDEERRFLSA